MNNLRSFLLAVLLFAMLITPSFAESQRVSCQSGGFSIVASPAKWEFGSDQGDMLAFKSSSQKTVMKFMKMPGVYPDLETFTKEFESKIEAAGKKMIPQGSELISETEALKFKLEFIKQNPQVPDMQAQVYMLLINKNIYLFEIFSLDADLEHLALFDEAAKSFKLEQLPTS